MSRTDEHRTQPPQQCLFTSGSPNWYQSTPRTKHAKHAIDQADPLDCSTLAKGVRPGIPLALPGGICQPAYGRRSRTGAPITYSNEMEPLSADELSAKYPDSNLVDNLRQILNVRTLLDECLISSNYRVPTDLHKPIALTEYGERAFNYAHRKQVPYPEARLLCFLETMHVDLLVDPLETDCDALISAISAQVKACEIRYPFIHGRLLYDRVADQNISTEKGVLTESETDEVLNGTPQGVFQVGQWVTGPYGILESVAFRYVDPIRKAPFHCSDLACDKIHTYILATAQDAEINKNRDKLRRFLQRESKNPSDWLQFLSRTNPHRYKHIYDDMAADSIIFLIGDALTIEEQRRLLAWLLDNTGADLRIRAGKEGLTGKSSKIVSSLNSAELMQLTLTCSDAAIIRGIDTLAMSDQIRVPEGEVRSAVINQFVVGPYRLGAELNRYGVRLRSQSMNIAPLRFRRLVSQMYPPDEANRSELDWQLRNETAESLESKIEQFLMKRRPRDAVGSLLLARRTNLIVATERLSISDELLKDDDDRVNSVMWKLGFSISDVIDLHSRFWRYHHAITQACSQALMTPPLADSEQIRERAGSYFPTLEEILRDSLLYTTWALTNDHYKSSRKFIYRPMDDERQARTVLHRFAEMADQDARVNLAEPLNLHALCRGFQILADYLSSFEGKQDRYIRPSIDAPTWAHSQEIQHFPFKHTIPFLDLLADSRDAIVSDLQEISRTLIAADVPALRNSLLHPRAPEIERLRTGLEAIAKTVVNLRVRGYARLVYREIRTEIDEAARATITLADPYDQQVVIHVPSYFDWVGFPESSLGVHFLLAARFRDPAGVLRFRSEDDSPFTKMWDGYPRRPSRPNTASNLFHPKVLSDQRME